MQERERGREQNIRAISSRLSYHASPIHLDIDSVVACMWGTATDTKILQHRTGGRTRLVGMVLLTLHETLRPLRKTANFVISIQTRYRADLGRFFWLDTAHTTNMPAERVFRKEIFVSLSPNASIPAGRTTWGWWRMMNNKRKAHYEEHFRVADEEEEVEAAGLGGYSIGKILAWVLAWKITWVLAWDFLH